MLDVARALDPLIGVVLRATPRHSLPVRSAPGKVEGLVRRSGLSPLTCQAFEKKGLTVAEDVIYLEAGDTPAGVIGVWGYVAAAGAGFLVLGIVIGLIWTAYHPAPPPLPAPVTSCWPATSSGPPRSRPSCGRAVPSRR